MKYIVGLLLCCFSAFGFAEEGYFVCGPDEDGCSSAYYNSCACIPHDGASAGGPYCLDFDKIACVPLSQMPNCPKGDVVQGQGRCLALLLQSEADPACELKPKQFCVNNHIPLCEKDGGVNTCH